MGRIGSFLLAVGLLAGVWWAARQGSTGAVNEGWAATYNQELRRVLNVPPSVELEFKSSRPSSEAGQALALFDAVEGEARDSLELSVSADGAQLFYGGRTYALADPFRALRESIGLDDAPARGPLDAAVTVVEFSDYTCAYCRQFYQTLEKPLLERYGNQVRLVYKHFPLVDVRAWSEDAAGAAACAYRQGNQQFWAYHERLFQEADRLKEGRPLLLTLASEAGLESVSFQRCLAERQGLPDIARDLDEAGRLAVEVTPTFFINGRPVYGFVRPEYFFYIIEQELAAARQP
jgi:protein-disulfide isomerase